MNTYKDIGMRLKDARSRSGLTQDQVAKYLGVAREMISYYENATREIDLVSLQKLADLYGYTIKHFLAEPENGEITIAFRADELDENDLEVVAWVQRVAKNLRELNDLLSKE
ncbi:MAG: helix-turn-helix domain-containing protein [Bacteroidota bacterium]